MAEPVPVDRVREQRGVGSRSLALVVLCALAVADFADRQVVVATFPYLRAEFGVGDTQLGALVAAVSVVVALGTLPVALVVDRWSRVRAIAVMGTVWSGATAACAFAPGYGALLAARIGIGVGQAGFGPAGAALLGAGFPRDRRATVLGVFQMSAPVGIVAGAVVGSVVAASWGWRSAFLVVALPGLILALLASRLRDYPSVVQESRGRATAAALFRARSAVGAMLGGALLLVVVSTLYTWLPTYLERAYGLPPARAGILGSLVVLAGAVGTASAGYVSDRLARRDVRRRMLVPAVAAVVTTATLGSAFAVVPPGAVQMVLVLVGAAMAATANAPTLAVVLDSAPPGAGATATSMFAMVQNLAGLAVGPVLTGALADRWGLTAALATVSGLGVAAGVALWCGARFYPGDRARVGLGPPSSRRPVVRTPPERDQPPTGALDANDDDASDDPIQRARRRVPQLGSSPEQEGGAVKRPVDVRAYPLPELVVTRNAGRLARRTVPESWGARTEPGRFGRDEPGDLQALGGEVRAAGVTDVVHRPRLDARLPLDARAGGRGRGRRGLGQDNLRGVLARGRGR